MYVGYISVRYRVDKASRSIYRYKVGFVRFNLYEDRERDHIHCDVKFKITTVPIANELYI